MSIPVIHVKRETPTFDDQDVYQNSVMQYLPEELFIKIIRAAATAENSCHLALVCRHWKQITYTIHPLYLLKQQHFTSLVEGFYLYSHVERKYHFENKQQVDKINQALEGWLPAFISNCQNARQAVFTLDNMWLTPFQTTISSPNQELANALEALRQLQISNYNPKRHLKIILKQTHETISFSTRLLITAIQLGYLSLKHIPPKLRCYAICLAAVQQDSKGKALQFVSKELITSELCLAAVQRNGEALQFVPKELIASELCLAAVQRNGSALRFVPEELRTPMLCLVDIQQNGRALEYVPEELKTPKLCLDAVQQNGCALEYVPEKPKTPELCLATVQQSGWAFAFVPEKLKNLKLCLDARQTMLEEVTTLINTTSATVQHNGVALDFLPKELRTLGI